MSNFITTGSVEKWESGSYSGDLEVLACRGLRRRCDWKDKFSFFVGSGVHLHYGFGMYGLRMSGVVSVCEFLVAVGEGFRLTGVLDFFSLGVGGLLV